MQQRTPHTQQGAAMDLGIPKGETAASMEKLAERAAANLGLLSQGLDGSNTKIHLSILIWSLCLMIRIGKTQHQMHGKRGLNG